MAVVSLMTARSSLCRTGEPPPYRIYTMLTAVTLAGLFCCLANWAAMHTQSDFVNNQLRIHTQITTNLKQILLTSYFNVLLSSCIFQLVNVYALQFDKFSNCVFLQGAKYLCFSWILGYSKHCQQSCRHVGRFVLIPSDGAPIKNHRRHLLVSSEIEVKLKLPHSCQCRD